MTIIELIDKHLRSAETALEERNFDDFSFAIRSLASFSEADKREYHMESISPRYARNEGAVSEAELSLFQEWLHLGSEYSKYLDDVAVLFGKKRSGSKLGNLLTYLNESKADEERRARKAEARHHDEELREMRSVFPSVVQVVGNDTR